MTLRKQLFTLALCAMTFFPGCGGPSHGGTDDQGTVEDECALNTDNCSPNAICTDTATAFTCACMVGYSGNGVVCVREVCEDATDCDDQVPCTVDSCSASGSCLHTPTSSLCTDSAVCDPTDGCTVGRICGSPSDCVDNDPCTQDEMCNASSATCVFAPLDNDEDDEVPLVCGGTDCDDDDDRVGAGGSERCGNGVDDDCDGVIDADATVDTDASLRYDESNCGTCGNVCGNGTTCYQGACVACGTTGAACCNTSCQSATSCSGGTCTNGGSCLASNGMATCSAAPVCGGAGQACCAGNSCSTGNVCGTNSMCQQVGNCGDSGTDTLYRLTALNIPTPSQASGGATVGHNVDGVGTTCGVPDYAGGVDNSLIDLAAALPSLAPDDPIDLQTEIDTALSCSASSQDCTRLDLIVSVRTGTGCAVMEIEDAEGNNLAGPFVTTLDASGNFQGTVASFDLSIPYETGSGSVSIDLDLTNVVISGNRSASALTNVVIGGSLLKTAFEAMIMDLLPFLGADISFEDISGILANLYDVQVAGQCGALSVGLTASGTSYP